MSVVSNIDIADFRRFLKYQGWNYICIKGGHEKWKKVGAIRPVIFQTHTNPIPIVVIKSNLRTMGCSLEDLINFLK